MRLPQQNRPGKPTRTRRNVPCWHSGDGLAFVAGAKVAGAGTDGLCAGSGVLFLKTRWTGAADNFSSGFGGRHCMNGDPGGILRRGERTWSGFPLGRLARAFAWQRLLAVLYRALRRLKYIGAAKIKPAGWTLAFFLPIGYYGLTMLKNLW